ncbi:hypothetical protein Trydic_g17665 [Trypoxylus dichotomus]
MYLEFPKVYEQWCVCTSNGVETVQLKYLHFHIFRGYGGPVNFLSTSRTPIAAAWRQICDIPSGPSKVKEEKPGSARKASRTQEDTQMLPISSRKEDTGGGRNEEESPAS